MRDERLTRIEEALAHQTALTEDLHEVVRAQGEEIARLTRRVDLLMRRAAETEADGGSFVPGDSKPPHY